MNKENKKKILFVLWSFSLGGGAEKILATICNNLDLNKYQIDILELAKFDKPYPKLDSRINILNSLEKHTQPRFLRALLWRFRKYFPRLTRKLLVNDVYDIEISFTIINPYFPFSKNKNVKKISWIHGSIESFKNDIEKLENHREGLKSVDKIVSISNKTKDSISELYPEYKNKIVNIYNGYNIESIIEKSQEEGKDQEIQQNSICVIGRIEDLKGSLEVYEVLKDLHFNKNKKYHLYYIGTGDLENKIKNDVKKDKLDDYVHFLGYQTNPYKYLKDMKVLLSMSKQEGFSGAVVESLVLGIPFVSTNVGGVDELSNNEKFGKKIENINQASNAIISYIENEIVVDKKAMIEYISNFTIEKQIEDVEKILQENYGN